MAMERYRREIETIERERINFLNKIDLVQPSFEEQHQLEVRQRYRGVRTGYGNCSAAPVQHSSSRSSTLFKRKRFIDKLVKRPTNLIDYEALRELPHISVNTAVQPSRQQQRRSSCSRVTAVQTKRASSSRHKRESAGTDAKRCCCFGTVSLIAPLGFERCSTYRLKQSDGTLGIFLFFFPCFQSLTF